MQRQPKPEQPQHQPNSTADSVTVLDATPFDPEKATKVDLSVPAAPSMQRDATARNTRADDEAPPAKYYMVQNEQRYHDKATKNRTLVKKGKVVSTLTHDILDMQLQGIELVEYKPPQIDRSKFVG